MKTVPQGQAVLPGQQDPEDTDIKVELHQGRDITHPVRHMNACIGGSGLKVIVNQVLLPRATSSECLSSVARPIYQET